MSDKLRFADVRAYLLEHGVEITKLPSDVEHNFLHKFLVEYPTQTGKRPRFYHALHNALVFNAPGGNDADVLRRFEEWRLARWQGEAL